MRTDVNLRASDLYVSLGALEWRAFDELNEISDYIYKSPRLLDHEKALERDKMAMYFPNGGKTADMRFYYESVKLNETFRV
jgi:hypothetical protein